jgi:MFS superfamily sulfate permease-like transporter
MLKAYTGRMLGRDLSASVVVFLVALPLCMGIAMASGVPASKGLITGIVGGIVVGALAGAPLQVSGPAAGLAVIVFELVREHGVSALGPVLLAAGALQLLAGIVRLGGWFRAISPAVVHGMLAAIGLIIAASQFHVMFDGAPAASGIANLLAIPGTVLGAFAGGTPALAALVAGVTILGSLLWEKLRPAALKPLPGALVGVVLGTLAAMLLALPVKRVSLPEDLLGSIEWANAGTLMALTDGALLASAAVIAVIASAETLLSAAAVDRMHEGPRADYDKELRAQGIGNMICGAMGALPMTGVIVRSSANAQAGAVSRLSAILHGVWILLFLAALPFVLTAIPTASLGGVLVLTGIKLLEPGHLKALAKFGRGPVLAYLLTFAAIVATDLLTGVLLGLAFSVAHLAWRRSHLGVVLEQGGQDDHRLVLSGAATFMRLPQLERSLREAPGGTVRLVTDRLHYIDDACMTLLRDWERESARSGREPRIDWTALQARSRPLAA